MKFLLGIDIGTSSTKSVLMDVEGEVLAVAQREYSIDTPKPNWAEQDPQIWWQTTIETVREVLNKGRINPREIAGVGFSGQMHGTVFLNKNQQVLRPAVIWADQRSAQQCSEIYEKVGLDGLRCTVGNRVAPGFMGATLLWIKKNEPKTFKKLDKVMLPKDYVRFKLCGTIATEVSDAASTLLFDIHKREWSEGLIATLGLPREILPEIHESWSVVGQVTKKASEQTGLAQGTAVVAGGGDQPVAAVGNGAIKEGIVLSTIGTGGQLFTTINKVKIDPQMRTHTFCHVIPKTWFLMGAMLSAGLSLKWFSENIGGNASYEELSEEAARVSPGSEGLIFLPYLIGERTPHMNPKARGVFMGLTLRHTKAHLARAIMEGVAFAMRDSLEIFKQLGVRIERIIASGGGGSSPLWRQIQADVYGSELVTANVREQAGVGAAILAGIGTGVYKSIEDACETVIKYINRTEPIENNIRIYEKFYNIFQGLYPRLKDDFEVISTLI